MNFLIISFFSLGKLTLLIQHVLNFRFKRIFRDRRKARGFTRMIQKKYIPVEVISELSYGDAVMYAIIFGADRSTNFQA